MLDIKKIRRNGQEVKDAVIACGSDGALVDAAVSLDARRRGLLTEVESLKGERNRTSKEVGALKKKGEDTSGIQARVREIGAKIGELDEQVRSVDTELRRAMLAIPNLPHESTPPGKDESGNVVLSEHGTKREFAFEPKNHVELAEKLGIIDLTRGAKLSGSGFPLYVGAGARLQRALIQFMLDLHVTEHGYTEVSPPILCNSDAMTGTGQLPKMAEDMYRLPEDDLYLIPTGEVPVANIYREEIIDQPLPIKLTAFTPCFRREAGAAGRETRGILRVHQFDKVEMIKFVHPDSSYDELETLRADAEDVIKRLGLSYRILQLCAGDLSFAAAKCYDIELWAPGQDDWLEVSSCSNCEAFQARRAGIRYRREDGKTDFVHILNGSGTALPRLIVAILENYQEADGSITLPDAIVPYMGGIDRIEAPAGS